mmetsp:Transcript_5787/g.6651  ORF Transcript_5787/g.6651 Transcript_5787/m.6651 type:complete len:98 (-) Transcript_5787:509-802(-)|eukprot:CAMPEP_0197858064 /NCGR_PEP_ID=MMETSP1438-20131217/31603_1 /TAXON_ID=1461541 /ORGANISM="Pterosperma sp., Strain CCMP1384" /LENGTH=97 /DNA_ID=CAMNT_0043474111 /DNA_START=283 /DNA_END=576 /DNA_ORIENTATION=+
MADPLSASLEARDKINQERETLSSSQLQRLGSEDQGWKYRLEQVDKDLATAEKGMEKMITEVKGIKTDIETMKSPQAPKPTPNVDYKEVSKQLAAQR